MSEPSYSTEPLDSKPHRKELTHFSLIKGILEELKQCVSGPRNDNVYAIMDGEGKVRNDWPNALEFFETAGDESH
jgi:hypothetical protein